MGIIKQGFLATVLFRYSQKQGLSSVKDARRVALCKRLLGFFVIRCFEKN